MADKYCLKVWIWKHSAGTTYRICRKREGHKDKCGDVKKNATV